QYRQHQPHRRRRCEEVPAGFTEAIRSDRSDSGCRTRSEQRQFAARGEQEVGCMFCCANHQFGPARFLKDVLGCFFAVTLMAATALSGTQGGPQVVNQEKSVLVTRLVVTFGTNTTSIWQSGFWDELRIIIRDRATWDTIWKRIVSPDPYHDPYNAVPPLPEIDFSREMLVVTAMGQRPSGGYRIMVNSVLEKNRRLE